MVSMPTVTKGNDAQLTVGSAEISGVEDQPFGEGAVRREVVHVIDAIAQAAE